MLLLGQIDNVAVKIPGELATVENIMHNNMSVIFTLESEFMIGYLTASGIFFSS